MISHGWIHGWTFREMNHFTKTYLINNISTFQLSRHINHNECKYPYDNHNIINHISEPWIFIITLWLWNIHHLYGMIGQVVRL